MDWLLGILVLGGMVTAAWNGLLAFNNLTPRGLEYFNRNPLRRLYSLPRDHFTDAGWRYRTRALGAVVFVFAVFLGLAFIIFSAHPRP